MASPDLAPDSRRQPPQQSPQQSRLRFPNPGDAAPDPTAAPDTPDAPQPARVTAAARRPPGRRPSSARTRLCEALVVAGPGLAVGALGWRQRWVGDDGMVYARTVRQLLAGHGPVFNVGERAEASGSVLWEWLVAAGAYASGADPSLVAVVLGVLLTGAGYALAVAAARRAVRRLSAAPLAPLGMIVLLALKTDWDYSSSGLETGLATGWIALAWWCLVAARGAGSARRWHAAAAVIGLGPLVQPRLVLVSAVFLVALYAVARPARLRALGLLGTAAALPAAYEVVRAGCYGVLLPLPALAADSPGAHWARGRSYVADFVQPYHLALPLVLLLAAAVVRLRRGALPAVRAELVAPPVAGLLLWAEVCRSGGDAANGRLLLPGLLLMALPLCAVPVNRAVGAAAAGLAGWAVVCALVWRPPPVAGGPYPVVDEQRAYTAQIGYAHPVTELAHARRAAPLLAAEIGARGAGARVLLLPTAGGGDAFVSLPLSRRTAARLAGVSGRLGYSGIVTPLAAIALDPQGVAYPLAAHRQRARTGPGGDGGADGTPLDPAWIVADLTDPGTPVPAGVDPARVRAARHALTCGRLADLQASVRAPLTPARFWRNLTGAWSRTGFRFPADPLRAERALCRG